MKIKATSKRLPSPDIVLYSRRKHYLGLAPVRPTLLPRLGQDYGPKLNLKPAETLVYDPVIFHPSHHPLAEGGENVCLRLVNTT